MIIIAKSAIKAFIKSHPDSENALDNWLRYRFLFYSLVRIKNMI
jgi:mRNA-degrading endonuclease HigB of HigAB toxin-antitoxin module